MNETRNIIARLLYIPCSVKKSWTITILFHARVFTLSSRVLIQKNLPVNKIYTTSSKQTKKLAKKEIK